ETMLDPKIFFRLNRSYITRLEAIDSVAKYFNGRLQINLRPSVSQDITVSREKANKFKTWLEG
ncbi:MAG: LytTR family transcriptional regulator DNA-binding domain-containing protein, partial [Cyclobacteriaceae bacterium]